MKENYSFIGDILMGLFYIILGTGSVLGIYLVTHIGDFIFPSVNLIAINIYGLLAITCLCVIGIVHRFEF